MREYLARLGGEEEEWDRVLRSGHKEKGRGIAGRKVGSRRRPRGGTDYHRQTMDTISGGGKMIASSGSMEDLSTMEADIARQDVAGEEFTERRRGGARGEGASRERSVVSEEDLLYPRSRSSSEEEGTRIEMSPWEHSSDLGSNVMPHKTSLVYSNIEAVIAGTAPGQADSLRRMRSRKKDKVLDLEREFQRIEHRAKTMKEERRALNRERTDERINSTPFVGLEDSADLPVVTPSRVGMEIASISFGERRLKSVSCDPDLLAVAGTIDKEINEETVSIGDKAGDKLENMQQGRWDLGGYIDGAAPATGKAIGTFSSLYDPSKVSGSGSSSNLSHLDANFEPDLHFDLKTNNWKVFQDHLQQLQKRPDLLRLAATVNRPDDGSTPLHAVAWRAPPTVALMFIALIKTLQDQDTIFIRKDRDGNTPLHLCCTNFSAGREGVNSGKVETSVLNALVQAGPNAVTVQNAEGDAPLHLLVTSPALCSEGVDYENPDVQRALTSILCSPGGTDSALLRDSAGATPLHVAIAAGAIESVLLQIVHDVPSCVGVKDIRGMLPLHYVAAFLRTPYRAVRAMVQAYPNGLTGVTRSGDTPLHLCATYSHLGGAENCNGVFGVDENAACVVDLLTGKGGEGHPLLATNREALTPLHCCVLFDAPPQLSRLMMGHPDAAHASSITTPFGATPLHLAAACTVTTWTIDTVRALGTPEAAATKDSLTRLPLHVLAQNGLATPELIKTIADLNPTAAACGTQRGHLPLHLAVQNGKANAVVIGAIITVFPDAARTMNQSGNTPLHDATKFGASSNIIHLVNNAAPEAARMRNRYGNLPLHCAVAYQAPADVIRLLLSIYPEGATARNSSRETPLYYAATYATDVQSVISLIDAAPEMMKVLTRAGQRLADKARDRGAIREIVELLERGTAH